MTDYIWYKKQGNIRGPFRKDQILYFLEIGKITHDTLISYNKQDYKIVSNHPEMCLEEQTNDLMERGSVGINTGVSNYNPRTTCPYCAEEIQDRAVKCKHCGELVTNQHSNRKQNARRHYREGNLDSKPVTMLGIAGCICGIMSLLFLPIIFSPLAIILSGCALGQIQSGQKSGGLISWIGFILGLIGTVYLAYIFFQFGTAVEDLKNLFN